MLQAREKSAQFLFVCRHGLGKLVTVQHRNIEENGFPGELHGKADALFLDLPGPWKVCVNWYPCTCCLAPCQKLTALVHPCICLSVVCPLELSEVSRQKEPSMLMQ